MTPEPVTSLPVQPPRLVVAGNGPFAQSWYEWGGLRYPRVTSITRVLDKPAIARWAARQTARYAVEKIDMLYALGKDDPEGMVDVLKGAPWRERDLAASLGSRVHSVIESSEQPSPDEEPFVTAYWSWVDRWGDLFQVVGNEVPCINTSLGYGGTADLIVQSVDERVAVWDIKTGKSVADNGVLYPEIRLQVSAYVHADVWAHDLPAAPTLGGVVHVRPEFVRFYPVDPPESTDLLAAVVSVAHWLGYAKTGGSDGLEAPL